MVAKGYLLMGNTYLDYGYGWFLVCMPQCKCQNSNDNKVDSAGNITNLVIMEKDCHIEKDHLQNQNCYHTFCEMIFVKKLYCHLGKDKFENENFRSTTPTYLSWLMLFSGPSPSRKLYYRKLCFWTFFGI